MMMNLLRLIRRNKNIPSFFGKNQYFQSLLISQDQVRTQEQAKLMRIKRFVQYFFIFGSQVLKYYPKSIQLQSEAVHTLRIINDVQEDIFDIETIISDQQDLQDQKRKNQEFQFIFSQCSQEVQELFPIDMDF